MAADPIRQHRPATDQTEKGSPGPDRAEILAALLAEGGLSGHERSAVENELHSRLGVAELALRRSIADCLKSSPHVPLGILMALVDDHNSVSIPILEHSPLLKEADLVRLAATATSDRRAAMARRSSIGAALAQALVESAEADIVATLLANRTADCSEPILMACLDRYPNSEAVHRALIGRCELPVAVALRLVTLASDELSGLLVARHPLPALPDTETVELTRNRPGWWSQQINGYFS